jgi:uracil-DNA glycosylase
VDRTLQGVMRAVLRDWRQDLAPAWQAVLAGVEPGFEAMDSTLELEPWEPVFPARRGKNFLGAPKGGHMLHAFDCITPDAVRCVVLGQDPYPCPAFSTGRAFEAGNVAAWRELEKMFSVSVRTFVQQIVAARTGDASYARTTKDWYSVLADIESGRLPFEPASTLADRWVASGALLLNSAFTITRFKVEGDPHQLRGHLKLWRPVLQAVLRHLAARGVPTVFIGFGDQAATALRGAGIAPGDSHAVACILREHPAKGDAVLALENPFLLANSHLARFGAQGVDW